MKFPALLFSLLIFGILLLLLAQSFLEARERENKLALLRGEVEALAQRSEEKKAELTYRNSPEFIEKQAREQLGWAKEGETIVVLPDIEEEKKSSSQIASAETAPSSSSSNSAPLPYWKQWRIVFFGN
ncbi:hypothetical protein A2797_00690 [candidate division WWE3 bacterium RIFCSPHIGHO2_01_FULL_48_15]|uniref:Septum formation initiator n=1 Tax=candidate division WWE3 bacterium RIFCSPHIGHO2_01_FULL_48_15 TaxID=1802619 RepID=A0A1F4VBI1_UNCKA|nr:MAG: hypothetical protein A2797_00690 [candidate division WWE3 bacterium RIFCSPHIGHO2_01_FULL_48_15]